MWKGECGIIGEIRLPAGVFGKRVPPFIRMQNEDFGINVRISCITTK